MSRFILVLFFGTLLFQSSAQLTRKPLLGARVEYVNDNENSGCKVVQVVRGASVELKLQENDIIVKIVNTVNHFHPGNATLITYPSTDHYFAKSGTMQEAYDKFVNGQIQQLFDQYNSEVVQSAVKWSDEVLKLNSFNK